MKIQSILLLLITAISFTAQANAPLRSYDRSLAKTETPTRSPSQGIETDFSQADFLKIIEAPLMTQEDVSRMIPHDLKPSSEGQQVESHIKRHFLSNLAKSQTVQSIGFLKSVTSAAKGLENATNFQVDDSDDSKNENADGTVTAEAPNHDIQHKLNFKLQALKGEAKLMYSGFIDSTMTYFQTNNSLVVTADKRLSHRSILQLKHTTDAQGNTQMLNYNFNW